MVACLAESRRGGLDASMLRARRVEGERAKVVVRRR